MKIRDNLEDLQEKTQNLDISDLLTVSRVMKHHVTNPASTQAQNQK
jgi:hypothetical protein